MRRFIFLAVILAASFALANAQTEKSPEFFVGYSFENSGSGVTRSDFQSSSVAQSSFDNRFNLNGFNLSGTAYVKEHLGIVGDFSAHFNRGTDFFGSVATRSKFDLYNVTAGPQYRFSSKGRFTPFTHALFGVAHINSTESLSDGSNFATDSNSSFAMNLGGGVDYKLNDRFAARLFQIDYNPIFLRNRTINGTTIPGQTQNGVRVSAGLVIK
jgi:opacity protein-like surface antigen